MDVSAGEIILISGRSGHGKSTLLELCAGLINPQKGEVFWDKSLVAAMNRRELHDKRENIGYVFQLHALISNYNIIDNIALPLRSRKEYNERVINSRVRKVMEDFGLYGIDKAFPESLSSGQLKRAAMARAFTCEPTMVMLDEPLSGIDQHDTAGIIHVLTEYRLKKKSTIIMISQDLTILSEFKPRKFILENGRLTEQI